MEVNDTEKENKMISDKNVELLAEDLYKRCDLNDSNIRMLTLGIDPTASTSDPKIMERNFRLPIAFSSVEDANSDANGFELVVSPEFVASFKCKKISKIFKQIEKKSAALVRSGTPARTVFKRKHRGYYEVTNFWTDNDSSIASKSEKNLKNVSDSSKAIRKRSKDHKKTERIDPGGHQTLSHIPVLENTIVAGWDTHEVQMRSINCLQAGQYLNEEVLEYGIINMFKNECGSPENVLCVPAYRWLAYFRNLQPDVDPGISTVLLYKLLVKKLPHRNLLRIKYLVIPVLKDNHWFLAVFCRPFPDESIIKRFEEKARWRNCPLVECSQELYSLWLNDEVQPPKVLIFDSMFEVMEKKGYREQYINNYHKTAAESLIMGLSWIHKQLWKATERHIDVDFLSMMNISSESINVQAQENRADCGLYLLKYIKCFIELVKYNGYERPFSSQLFEAIYKRAEWKIQSRKGLFEAIRMECQTKAPEYYVAFLRASQDLFA